jgi:hypothetical protein
MAPFQGQKIWAAGLLPGTKPISMSGYEADTRDQQLDHFAASTYVRLLHNLNKYGDRVHLYCTM